MIQRVIFDKQKLPCPCLQENWRTVDQISPFFILSTLIGEDCTFFHHVGVHFPGIGFAIDHLLKGDEHPSGASTITQQTAKNLFLYPKRSYFRKAIEVYYALLMEKIWGKERILEMYVNIIEMGDGAYGIAQGSRRWLGKEASDLCFDEACLMSSVLPNPKALCPEAPSRRLMHRTSILYKKGFYQASAQKNCPPLHAENFPFIIS